jgi:hypothetical protein
MEQEADIIHLQNAHVTQYSGINGKSNWKIRKNITNEDLAELPGHLTEKDVFQILDVARKFELIAFNEGIVLGKKISKNLYEPVIDKYKEFQIIAKEENERLADKLEQLIGSKED